MDTLYQLAGQLTGSFSRGSQHRFVNDIPEDMQVKHNCDWVRNVIGGLLTTVLGHAHPDHIRLSAKTYGYIIVFEIQKPGSLGTEINKYDLRHLQSMAEKIGGCITVTSLPADGTSIAFSFPNLPLAA